MRALPAMSQTLGRALQTLMHETRGRRSRRGVVNEMADLGMTWSRHPLGRGRLRLEGRRTNPASVAGAAQAEDTL